MLRRLRLIVLLLLLVFVALASWLERRQSTDWDGSLLVALYPVAADDSEAARTGREGVEPADLAALEQFFAREAVRQGLALERPLRFVRAPEPDAAPPLPSAAAGAPGIVAWSLRFKWWNWRVDDPPGPTPTIRLYLLYHDPERSPRLPHSLGLANGLLGIVHVFAAAHMRGSNHVVTAHELLHTLGATDRYDPATNQPIWPDGYAEPDASPRYPQRFAELMAGRIPVRATESRIPASLGETRIGERTAREIGWRP